MWSGYTYTWNISASTTASQYWYGAEGSSLYHTDNSYSQGNGYLHNSGSSVTISTSSSNAFVPYAVTVTTVNSTSTGVTINSGADILTATGNSNYTAQSAAYQIGYTNYKYNNNTNHYVDANGNSFTGTPAAANISYLWSLTPNDYASVSGTTTTGTVNVSSLPETDITLTLTVTATADGGTPAAPANTTFTDSKQITIQGTKPTAPIISVSGTTVTLSTTAVGSTSIRYTTDGTDPTASTGTVYSGAIDLSASGTSPVTIKAVTVRSGNASDVSTETVTLTLAAPVITVDGAAGTATITAAAGTTIYYTTNGSTPTTSSTQYTGTLTGLSLMTTVKAIAVKSGWNDSPVASETLTIPSGVSDGVVTLFDYEDHSWSYYSDPDCPIHSLNPADVKITYNGNGTGTVQTNNSDSPSTWGANATTVKVGIDANASTFIYYETLERTDGRTAASVAAATGRCAYTTIANPFSVRPTYSSDATSVYRGFYAWRVKSLSGGTIHSAATGGTSYGVGSTINAETEIYFAPSSEYGMEVEFEALWARAYVSTSAAPSNSLGVERNFYVITASATSNITASTNPCTYTSIYPNGTTNGTTAANSVTVYKYGGFTANADSKIEYIILRNNSSTVNANGKNFTIGRGVSGYNGGLCADNLYGLNANATTSFRFNFASGSFTNLYFCGDGRTMSSGVLTSVIGCDYDRAMGDNSKLEITTDIIAGHNGNGGSNNNEGADFFRCTVKSGDFDLEDDYGGGAQFYLSLWGNTGSGTYGKKTMIVEGGIFSDISGGIDVEDNDVSAVDMVEIRVKGGTVNGALYGAAQYAAAYGNRYIIITGGEMKGWVAGGANGTQTTGGKLTGNTYVYFGGNARCDSEGSNTTMGSGNATGGNIFGAGSGNSGAADNATVGEVNQSTVVIADNAYVERNVYGGGNYGSVAGTGADNKSDMYILGGTVHGNVFGGSNMKSGNIVNYNVKGGTVNGGIYGGSNARGSLSGNVTMDISGGTIEGGVFGGGYGTAENSCDITGTVGITMTGGTVLTGVYGGGNVNSKIGGNATININGGQVGTSSNNASVYGGGLGAATRMKGNVTVNVGSRDNSCNVSGTAVIYGDVYGGSAKGVTNCNDGGTARNGSTVTNVTLNKGTIYGSIYGGGHGIENAVANVWGPVAVKVFGGSVNKTDANGANGSGGVYGCNNLNGAPQNTVTVDIYGTDPAPSVDEYALFSVYGGGNQANYSYGTPTVKVHNCDNSIEYVYGGGNAAHITNGNTDVTIYGGNKIGNVFGGGNGTVTAANVSGNTNVKIYGGTILSVFGGSNSRGNIGGSINVTAKSRTEAGNDPCGNAYTGCPIQVGELYGGGNLAASNVGNITIGCMNAGDMIDYVYGGANQADITGDINLTMTGGRVGNLFGGNNTSGTISGGITVNVNWVDTCSGSDYLGNVFGGGNLAQYTIPGGKALAVNILNGTVSDNVYGGGKGLDSDHSKGQVTGNPIVTIGDNTNSHTAIVEGDVYGGGDAGNVVGTPQVNVINKCNTNVANVYGGGNAADVSATDVNIDGGTIGMVFGGGHGDKNSMPQKEANVNGAVAVDVTGGTIDKVFGGSNSKGTISGDILVTVEKVDTSCDMHITEVYGGGNEAEGNAGEINIVCTGGASEGIDYVYGGANQANVTSDIDLNITGGKINNVFGGNNTSGNITGSITVNVEWDNNCAQNYLGNVYGAGNQAAYKPTTPGSYPAVNIKNGTVSNNVFGGGLGATAKVYSNPVVTIGDVTAGHGSYVATVTGNVYGGGSAAMVGDDVPATASTNNTSVIIQKANSSVANVFGGGAAAGVTGTTSVSVTGGTVSTGVYGGCDASGTVAGAIAVNITGGTVGASGTHAYGVFGGGFGSATRTGDAVTVTVGDGSSSPTVYGDIYGGSAEGYVNDDPAEITKVWLQSGTVNGDIYGGGFGDNGANALVNGSVQVVIDGGTMVAGATSGGRVFGCNNANGTPKGTVTVTINGTDATVTDGLGNKTYALKGVYGGGNLAAYVPTTASDKCVRVIVDDCDASIDTVYGGGNAAPVPQTDVTINGGDIRCVFAGGNGSSGTPANVGYNNKLEPTTTNPYGLGTASVTIVGGTIVDVFGGSNAHGVIREGNTVNISGDGTCDLNLTNVYGGGNEADGGSGTLTIDCTDGGLIDYVYGGANQADVDGDIELNIVGGRIEHVFGGNNASGTITGSITVNVEWDALKCNDNYLGYVYGGGNLAAYTAPTAGDYTGNYPIVNIKNGTVTHDVFGGGYGAAAVVTGNPVVTVGDPTVSYNAVVLGNVFGGGNAAAVSGNTDVNIIHRAVVGSLGTEGKVFGGGNAAVVTGDTKVYLGNRAKIYGNVYGGGNQGEVNGDTKVIVNSD